jgi:putative transposase
MAHSYTSCMIHFIFSTKGRQKIITSELQERLWPYIGGIAKARKMKALAVGGTQDHVHILLSMPSTISVSKAIQEIKAVSSKWIHENFPHHENFAWQQGYSAFSVSISHVNKTISYINSQNEHHRRKTFKEELVSFLKAHGIEYDQKYIWG